MALGDVSIVEYNKCIMIGFSRALFPVFDVGPP